MKRVEVGRKRNEHHVRGDFSSHFSSFYFPRWIDQLFHEIPFIIQLEIE